PHPGRPDGTSHQPDPTTPAGPAGTGEAALLRGGCRPRRCWVGRGDRDRQTWPEPDGLYVPSTMTLHPIVVLYPPATASLPPAPLFARAINHPSLAGTVMEVARRLEWPIRTTS